MRLPSKLFFLPVFLILACPFAGAQSQNPSSSVSHIKNSESPAEALSRQTVSLAQGAMDRKDYSEALRICSTYLKKNPDDAAVHFELGYAYTALRQAGDAEREYRRASELDPKMAAAFLNLGLTLLETRPGDASAPLQRAAELSPDQVRPKLLLGVALEHAGNLNAAAEQFRAALAIDSRNFDIHLELARVLLRSKQYVEASAEFRKASELQPDSAIAHLGLARSLSGQNLTSEAEAELAAYLRLRPEDADIHIERATLLSDLAKNDEAVAELDRAAAIRPEDLTTLKLRAVLGLRQKNYDAALAVLQKAESIAPGDADVHARIGHMLLEKKDYPGAVKELAAAYRADPSQPEPIRDLTAAQYLAGNYQAALQLIDFLSKREALPKGAWYIRASCYDKMNDKQKALDAYRKFLELNGDQNNDEYFAAAERARILDREIKEKKK